VKLGITGITNEEFVLGFAGVADFAGARFARRSAFCAARSVSALPRFFLMIVNS
jgi:hypothetical protein